MPTTVMSLDFSWTHVNKLVFFFVPASVRENRFQFTHGLDFTHTRTK